MDWLYEMSHQPTLGNFSTLQTGGGFSGPPWPVGKALSLSACTGDAERADTPLTPRSRIHTGGGLRHSGTDPGGGRSRAGGNPRQGSRDGGFRPGILPGVQLLPGGNGADHRPQPHDRTLDPLRWGGGWLEAEALPGGEGNLALQSGESRWNFHFQGEDLVFDGGSPLHAWADPEAEAGAPALELSPGQCIPLAETACLYSDIPYRLEREGSSASLDFDLEAMTCTLVATDGMVYSGAISIDEGRIRLEIPTGAFFLLPAAADGIEVSNLLEAVTIAPELEDATLLFQYAG